MESAVIADVLLAALLGGWEIVLILAVVLIVLGVRNRPPGGKGLRYGISEFRKAINGIGEELHSDPKESGIVYEALTHENRTTEFVYPHPSNLRESLRTMILALAQGFGVGRIPLAPGTWGSLVGVIWTLILCVPGSLWMYLVGMVAGIGVAIWICGRAEEILRQKDPPSVVLDEIVAVPLCFLPFVLRYWLQKGILPTPDALVGTANWPVAIAVFALFRFFDIAKPWPVKQSQSLPRGWGVVVDDLIAAVYVVVVLSSAIGLGWLP